VTGAQTPIQAVAVAMARGSGARKRVEAHLRKAAAVLVDEAAVLELGDLVVGWLLPRDPAPNWAWAHSSGSFGSVWLEGELIGFEGDAAADDAGAVAQACAALAAANSQGSFDAVLQGLWGPSSGVVVRRDGVISAFVDRCGVRRMYYFGSAEDWTAFSSLSMARAMPAREVDAETYLDCVRLGEPVGRRTIIRGLSRLAPGERVDVGPSGISQAYWFHFPANRRRPQQEDQAFEELLAAHRSAAEAILKSTQGSVAVALTGGHDSRVVDATMLYLGSRPLTLTLNDGSEHLRVDAHIARKLARAAGQPWQEVPSPFPASPESLPTGTDILFLTDGSFDVPGMALLGLGAATEAVGIIIGLGADFLGGRSSGTVDPRSEPSVHAASRGLHLQLSRYFVPASSLERIVVGADREAEAQHQRRWLATWDEYADLSPPEAYARHQIRCRQANVLAPRLDSVRLFSPVYYPYVCPAVFDAYTTLPDRLWAHGRAHSILPGRLFPPFQWIQPSSLWPLPIPQRFELQAIPLKAAARRLKLKASGLVRSVRAPLSGQAKTVSDRLGPLLRSSPRLHHDALEELLRSSELPDDGSRLLTGLRFLEWSVRTFVSDEATPGVDAPQLIAPCLPDLSFRPAPGCDAPL
jgi:hypothetical protein